jgi:hypothetical protein
VQKKFLRPRGTNFLLTGLTGCTGFPESADGFSSILHPVNPVKNLFFKNFTWIAAHGRATEIMMIMEVDRVRD